MGAGPIKSGQNKVLVDELQGKDEDILKIYTLGRFAVKKQDLDLTEKSRRSTKIWDLFKFFITNRDKMISADRVVDSLWPDQDYFDQKAALHTLCHRMRSLFYEEFAEGSEPFVLKVSQGAYCMKLNHNCWLDAEVFLKHSQQAEALAQEDREESIKVYRRAISLYRGEYMPEHDSNKWLLPAKRYYRNLYLQNLLGKLKLLMEEKEYTKVQSACERAFQIDQFLEVEAVHLYFMEALLKNNKAREALCHHDILCSSLQTEFGVKPSAALRDMQRHLKSDVETDGLNLQAINDKLKEREGGKGSFCCDPDFFRFLYRLEKRRSERLSQEVAIGLFNVSWEDFDSYCMGEHVRAMDTLERVLMEQLRKGDVITRWSDTQYLAFLLGVSRESAKTIFSRVKSNFASSVGNGAINLEVSRRTKLD